MKALNFKEFWMTRLKTGFRLGALCLIGALVTVGCASTATLKSIPGQNVEIELQFNGPIDTSRYSYVIAFSTKNILLPPQDKYLPLPGLNFSQDFITVDGGSSATLADYYQNYFDTWTDFIVVGPQGTKLHRHKTGGYFPSTLASNDDHFSFSADTAFGPTNTGASSGTVKFSFSLNSLSIQPSILYFAFFTVGNPYDLTATSSGRIIDQINSSDTQMQTVAVTQKSGSAFRSPIRPAAEFKSWRIKVY